MAKIELTKENIIEASKTASSLTGIWKALGGKGSIPGSTAKKMRELVSDIQDRLARKDVKTPGAKPKAGPKATTKHPVPRHPKNPFRPGSSYGLLVDLIAQSGSKGIGRDELIKSFCKLTGKDDIHAKYDLAVINSASEDAKARHRSCRDGFTVILTVDNYRVKFD